MANSCPTESGKMNNSAGASIATFNAGLGGAAGLMGSSGLAGNAGLPTSIQALPRVVEAEAPAAMAVISELLEPCRK
jgi:hypothetical protein